VGSSLSRYGGDRRQLRATLPRLSPFALRACVADHLAIVLAQRRNPSQKITARTRRAPDTLPRRRDRIAGIHGLSIDTIELHPRNMIDELAPRLVHGSYR
jgi:hypothetical protein